MIVTVDVFKQEGRTPLMLASWKGQFETVIELLRQGVVANNQDQVLCLCVGRYIIMLYAGGAHFACSSYAKFNFRSCACVSYVLVWIYLYCMQEGLTSLILATQNGHLEVVDALLGAKADPDITENVKISKCVT